MSDIEKQIEQILYSNDPSVIAGELSGLLLAVGRPEAVGGALALLYPKTDHCEQSMQRFIAEQPEEVVILKLQPGAANPGGLEDAICALYPKTDHYQQSMGRFVSRSFEETVSGYTVVMTPDLDAGGYVVTCPALPGMVTEGDTLEEARSMAAEAIAGILATL